MDVLKDLSGLLPETADEHEITNIIDNYPVEMNKDDIREMLNVVADNLMKWNVTKKYPTEEVLDVLRYALDFNAIRLG